MSYRGTGAARLDAFERAYEFEAEERMPFEVVEGGGIDARVRRGVTSSYVAHIHLAMLAVVLFVVLGIARVFITTATVGYLRMNLVVQEQIEQASEANASLRIERSVLSNTARITRIASQNYGMYHAVSHERIDLTATNEDEIADLQTADVKPAEDGSLPTNADMIQTASEGSFSSLVQAHVNAACYLMTGW